MQLLPMRHLCHILLLGLSVSPFAMADTAENAVLQRWLSDYTASLREEQRLTGVSTAIALPDGTTLVASSGLADTAGQVPLTPRHRMPGGSTGKTHAAVTLLRLVERGLVELDAPVSSYLGGFDWFGSVPNSRTMTVVQLLNHSAGVPHYLDDWGFRTGFLLRRLIEPEATFSHEEMLAFVLDEAPTLAPGTGHHYSDLHYFLIGFIIEAVTGEPYYAVLEREILEPLALADTLPATRRDLPGLANGYAEATWLNRLTGIAGPSLEDGLLKMDPSIEWTGGGLIQTPRSLARFFQALGDGLLLDNESLRSMRQRAVPITEDAATRYGLGVYLSKREELGEYLSHAGFYPGYLSNAAYFREGNYSIAIQVNQDFDADVYTPLRDIAARVRSHLADPEQALLLRDGIWMAGERIGTQESHYFDNRQVNIRSNYRTQGKEPWVATRYRLDSQRRPVRMERQGQAYLYHTIDEHFLARDDGAALWRNRLEQGYRKDSRGAYYLPYDLLNTGDAAPAEKALLAAAALQQPQQTIALLPNGEARVEVLLESRQTLAGETLALRLLELSGPSLEPVYFWVDGATRFFAELGNARVIREGFESWLEGLENLETTARAKRREEREVALTHSVIAAAERPAVIEPVAVLDVENGVLQRGRRVVLRDGRIDAITEAGGLLPPQALVIDGAGGTLLPGLWDLHTHLSPGDGARYLAAGVTSVRDMGNDPAYLDAVAEAFNSGARPGPRVLKAGFIDRAGPLATPLGRLVSSLAEAGAAVDAYAANGYRQIKTYGAIPEDWLAPLTARAHAQGLRISGHVPVDGTLTGALDAGYDEVQHLVFLWLNFAGGPVEKNLTYEAARIARRMGRRSPAMTSLLARMAAGDMALDPTLAIYEQLLTGRKGVLHPAYAALAPRLPPQTLRGALAGPLPITGDLTQEDLEFLFTASQALVHKAWEAGVAIAVGTDHRALPGFSYVRELKLLAEAGIPRAEVLYLATAGAAELLSVDDRLGTVEVGKRADLVLVRGNPLESLNALRDIIMVWRDGRGYPAGALETAGGLLPANGP